MVKGNQSVILLPRKPSASILRTISTNSLNDRKKGTKKISFSKNVFFQEMLNDGSSHVFQELLKETCQLTKDSRVNQVSDSHINRPDKEDARSGTIILEDSDDKVDEDDSFFQINQRKSKKLNRNQGIRRSFAIIKRRRDSSLNAESSFNLSSSFNYERPQNDTNQNSILSFLGESHLNGSSIKTNDSLFKGSMVYPLNESSHRSDSHIDSFIINETMFNTITSPRMSQLDASIFDATKMLETLDEAEDTIGGFINKSSRLEESTYSLKDSCGHLKEDSMFNYIEKETASFLELSESKDEEETPLHSTFDCRQQSLTFLHDQDFESTIPSDDISHFIDNDCPSPSNSNFDFDLSPENKSKAIESPKAERKVSLQYFSGSFIVEITETMGKYENSSKINTIRDIRVHCCLDKLLEAQRMGKIMNDINGYFTLKSNRFKMAKFLKDFVFSSLSRLIHEMSGQKSAQINLTDLIAKISHKFSLAEKLMEELAELYPLHGHNICKLDDGRYQFCFHMNGLRRNIFLMIDLNLDVYPLEKALFKFGIHKDDLHMYPVHRFTNYLSLVAPGNYTYIRRLVKSARTFVKMIGLSRYASTGLKNHFSQRSLIIQSMASNFNKNIPFSS